MNADPMKSDGPLAGSVEKLRQELDRWMDAARSQGERAIDAFGLRGRVSGPEVDVVERADNVLVTVNLPGIDPAAIDVTLVGNMLTIQGTFPRDEIGEGERLHQAERPQGAFKRSVPLPACVDPQAIEAQCQLGVLRVTIRRSERERARKIVVGAGGPTSPPEPQAG